MQANTKQFQLFLSRPTYCSESKVKWQDILKKSQPTLFSCCMWTVISLHFNQCYLYVLFSFSGPLLPSCRSSPLTLLIDFTAGRKEHNRPTCTLEKSNVIQCKCPLPSKVSIRDASPVDEVYMINTDPSSKGSLFLAQIHKTQSLTRKTIS